MGRASNRTSPVHLRWKKGTPGQTQSWTGREGASMRWPGERDGSRPPVWAQGAVWISRWLSASPAGGKRSGVVKTPLPFDPSACGTANPSSADLELLPAGTCRPTGVSYLPEFRSLAARPSEAAISSTLCPPTKVRRPFRVLSAHPLIQSCSIASPPVGGSLEFLPLDASQPSRTVKRPQLVQWSHLGPLLNCQIPTRECTATALSRALAYSQFIRIP